MLWHLVLKDLKIFFADRRALVISMLVPIGIACFMSSIFSNASHPAANAKMPMLLVDEDASPLSQKIVANLSHTPTLEVRVVDEATAYGEVKDGKSAVALIIPKRFHDQVDAEKAGGPKPELTVLSDPGQTIAAQAVRGTIVRPIISAMFGAGPEPDLPFNFKDQTQEGDKQQSEATSAHVFAGMAIQGLLFFSIEAAMGVMRERKQGIWKRIRAAPVSPLMMLLARIASGALRALSILAGVLGFGMVFFHMHVGSNWPGLILICVAAALMAASFGLFVSALGRNEQQSRGLSIFVVLTMTMLGGAWFPSFLMPVWVQRVSLAIPVKWAVDGLDAMTWRNGDFAAALSAGGALLAFAAVFAIIALARFRWDSEAT